MIEAFDRAFYLTEVTLLVKISSTSAINRRISIPNPLTVNSSSSFLGASSRNLSLLK